MPDDIEFSDVYVDDAIIDRATEVLRNTRYVKGPVLDTFETEFAALCDTEHAVGVSNGTAALSLSLRAADIGAGDDVLVPAHTFFATVSSVLDRGAHPVFVDVDPVTYTMDTDDLARKVTAATNPQAVIPVHLYGQPVDMSAIDTVATEHELTVIEDAAQAHGAVDRGDRVGGIGDIGCFSFYPSKNMTVGGDGGMVVTDDDEIADRVRTLRNHGRDADGTHVEVGLNHRLDELNAAIGREQLTHLDEWNRKRRAAARRYTKQLEPVDPVETPSERDGADHVYHLYVIQIPDRDALQAHLEEAAIATGIHYPTPAHRHPAVVERVDDIAPVETAERLADRVLSLPMHPRITDEEIDRVCATIATHYGASA